MFSLMDAVEEKKVSCKVPGCHQTWSLGVRTTMKSWADETYRPPRKMCPSCYQNFQQLSPIEVTCHTKDCDAQVTIDAYQQLVLKKKKKRLEKEPFFCEACKERSKEMDAQEVPCRMKTCSNTWTWYATSQLAQGGSETKPPPHLCKTCYQKLKGLSDQMRPCSIEHCKGEWKFGRMMQLEFLLSKKPEPRRKCPQCMDRLQQLTPQSLECRVTGCTESWEWSPYAQLNYERQKEQSPETPMPERYCQRCFVLTKKKHDTTLACLTPSCSETIAYSVMEQIEDTVQHHASEQRRTYCKRCQQEQQQLKPQDISCQIKECDHTWVWTAEVQFTSGHYEGTQFKVGEAPSHYCERCRHFIEERKDTHVNCEQCQSPILWTTRQQLMTEIGAWVAPHLCPRCLKQS